MTFFIDQPEFVSSIVVPTMMILCQVFGVPSRKWMINTRQLIDLMDIVREHRLRGEPTRRKKRLEHLLY